MPSTSVSKSHLSQALGSEHLAWLVAGAPVGLVTWKFQTLLACSGPFPFLISDSALLPFQPSGEWGAGPSIFTDLNPFV